MNPSNIFVVVPVFNEAAELEKTLQSLMAHKYRIVLVDDGSTDNPERIARKYPVIFLQHVLNLGQGAALRTGMMAAQHAGADIIVHFDADGQHDAAEIHQLIQPLIQNACDIVFGSRFLKNTTVQQVPFFRKFILQAGRYVNWIFYRILLSDAHNGFRAMNRTAFEKIIFTQNRMGHASEILYLVKKNNLRYLETPVSIYYTKYSLGKGQHIFNSVNIIFDLIFKKLNK